MLKIGVLISGNGTNLQAVMDGINNEIIKGKIELIISNNKDAYGLVRGRKAGIESIYIDWKKYDHTSYSHRLLGEFQKRQVDLIVLAGFLKILPKEFVSVYKNRIINIHPSLIPSFCGKGFYGEKVHQAVLDYGVKYTGATVHFVEEGADTGPIILQEVVAVDEEDTVETLKQKVLKIEHKLLVESIRLYSENRLIIDGRIVKIK